MDKEHKELRFYGSSYVRLLLASLACVLSTTAQAEPLRLLWADTNVTLNGQTQNLSLIDGKLTLANQTDLLNEAVFKGTLSNNKTLQIKLIKGKRVEHHQDVLWLYNFAYKSHKEWRPLCGLDNNGSAIYALALAGHWDYSVGQISSGSHINAPSHFTIACQNQGLAKCVFAGYAPWKQIEHCQNGNCRTIRLDKHHQACTRLLRADFCGDGNSYTQKGVLINYYDALGIRYDADNWRFEAEWTAEGAKCIKRPRLNDVTPSCMSERQSPDCGNASHLGGEALLFSEQP